jgi:hypothetical protein
MLPSLKLHSNNPIRTLSSAQESHAFKPHTSICLSRLYDFVCFLNSPIQCLCNASFGLYVWIFRLCTGIYNVYIKVTNPGNLPIIAEKTIVLSKSQDFGPGVFWRDSHQLRSIIFVSGFLLTWCFIFCPRISVEFDRFDPIFWTYWESIRRFEMSGMLHVKMDLYACGNFGTVSKLNFCNFY